MFQISTLSILKYVINKKKITGSLRKQGLGVSPIVQQNQEFSIQNEDFPALPGFKGAVYSFDLVYKYWLFFFRKAFFAFFLNPASLPILLAMHGR